MTSAGLPVLTEHGLLDAWFLQLIDGEPAGVVVKVLALVAAATIGAVHALGPGHGKALLGAYLVGSQGRTRDAIAVAASVAIMHTCSVLLLGFGLFTVQRVPGGERLDAVLTILSAGAVACVGTAMLWRQRHSPLGRRMLRTTSSHSLVMANGSAKAQVGQGDHVEAYHGHGRHHGPAEGVAPMSRAGLVALATSGGLLPSPSALLVLASALAVGRVGYGLALITAFSVGLAATLAAIGVAVSTTQHRLLHLAAYRPQLLHGMQLLPIIGATGVLLGGILIAAAAIMRL